MSTSRFSKSQRFIFGLVLSVFLCSLPLTVLAQSAVVDDLCKISEDGWNEAIRMQLSIPGVTVDNGDFHYVKNLQCYISGIYRYFASVAGILATVMMMYGGIKYVISFGSPEKMNQAKDTIVSALLGLALTIGSYFILYFINPNLTTLKFNKGFEVITKEFLDTVWCDCDNPEQSPDSCVLDKNGIIIVDANGEVDPDGDPSVCGTRGKVPANSADKDKANSYCYFQGDCREGEICWTGVRGNEFQCGSPKEVCQNQTFKGDDGKAVCGVINNWLKANRDYGDKVCVPDYHYAKGEEGSCKFTNIFTCKNPDKWKQVTCSYGGNTVCFDEEKGKPKVTWPSAGSIPFICADGDAGFGWNTVCCAELQDVNCRDKVPDKEHFGCNNNEIFLPNCEFNGQSYTKGTFGANTESCTFQELQTGNRICCMQIQNYAGTGGYYTR